MFNQGYIAATKKTKTVEGSGILSISPPLGVWTVINLGAGTENKTVQINCVSNFGTRTCGVRPEGSTGGILIPVSFNNSTPFLVQANENGQIEVWRNNNGVSFYHISTLD